MISLACPQCGRKLRARPELAGKKVKCPCGQLVAVPAAARTPAPASGPDLGATVEQPSADQQGAATESGLDTHGGARAPAERELADFLAPPQAADELGRLGPYRVLRVLGAGGMGVVFAAEDPQLMRPVALKAMLPVLAASAAARERFLREARAAAALKHDHVVTIYQVGEDRGIPFLAMEFLDGEPLDARLGREGRLPVAELLRVGAETAEGLAAAHARGLIHRDIKPGNLWLENRPGERGVSTPRYRVKILDFGLARASADEGHLTQSGAILGTPAYMAPEQGRGEKVDARADLFSLGCVLYRAATGQPPFKGKDVMSTLMSLAMDTPPPPSSLRPDLPPALSDLIVRLLSKDPAGRPESAQAVAEELRQIADRPHARPRRAAAATAGTPANAPTEVIPGRPAAPQGEGWRRRSGGLIALVLLLGGGAVLLAVAGAVAFFLIGSADRAGPSTKAGQAGPKPTGETAPPKEERWLALFNGRDFTGWETIGGGKWWVKDGVLRGDGSGTGWLATTRAFADFDLMLEYRLPVRGNSGVFLRADPTGPVDGSGFIEIQLLDDASYPNVQADMHTGAVFHQVAPSPPPNPPAEKWHVLHIRLHRRHVQVWLNGIRAVDAGLKRDEKSGRIGLQQFGTPVEFRNIRAQEVSSSPQTGW